MRGHSPTAGLPRSLRLGGVVLCAAILGLAVAQLVLLLGEARGFARLPLVTRTLTAAADAPASIAWRDRAELLEPAARRVILVTVDTLRPDHLSAYGYPRPTSPVLERLVREEAVRFDRAYAPAPWTLPSMTSLFTSLDPNRHGVEDRGTALASEIVTLATAFGAQGWHTASFVTHIYVSSLFGLDNGFREFHELSIHSEFGEGFQLRADAVNDRVLPWITARGDDRYFLHVHYFDPHWDYDAPEPYGTMFTDPAYRGDASGEWTYLEQFVPSDRRMAPADLAHVVGLYDGEIRFTDGEIGRLFDHLERLDLWDDSVVIVTSDHGEEFQEHGSVHHIRTLYEEVLRVPLIVKPVAGAVASTRRQVSETVRTIDVAPTALELAGLTVPRAFEGASLVPLLRDPGKDRAVYARTVRHGADKEALVRGWWKVIRTLAETGQAEIYDLASDPGELRSLAGTTAATERELTAELAGLAERRCIGCAGTTVAELSDVQIERLQALGYSQ